MFKIPVSLDEYSYIFVEDLNKVIDAVKAREEGRVDALLGMSFNFLV